MTPESRRTAIVELVTAHGESSIEQLAQHFGVSLQTVRSDLRMLTSGGLLLRRHGMVAPFARENIGYQQREIVNIAGKRWIGERTALLLGDYQSCFLGTGTTVEMVARALPEASRLAVFTNNLHAAEALSRLAACELTVAGGRVRKRYLDVIGSDAQCFFSRYRRALVASAAVSVLVVDSTKFGRNAICQNGSVGDFDYVVSDRPPTPQQHAVIKQRGTAWLSQA